MDYESPVEVSVETVDFVFGMPSEQAKTKQGDAIKYLFADMQIVHCCTIPYNRRKSFVWIN